MLFKKKDKKKKKANVERFVSLSANGVAIEAINFSFTRDKQGEPQLEVRTKDVCEALHYSEVDFELKTNVKRITVHAHFKEAVSEKHFKLYLWSIDDYNQFFI